MGCIFRTFIIMEEVRKEALTNKEVNLLQRYRSRIKEIEVID